MKAFTKSILRTFKSNIARFISLTCIILLGICFVSGIGALSPKILDAFDVSLKQDGVADVIVKSVSTTGFTEQELQDLKDLPSVEIAQEFTALDGVNDDIYSRLYIAPFDIPINSPVLVEGRLPLNGNECLVERASDTIDQVAIGDVVSFTRDGLPMTFEFTVTGIARNPLMFAKDGDVSIEDEDKTLSLVMYAHPDMLKSTYQGNFMHNLIVTNLCSTYTDVYVKVSDAQQKYLFSNSYQDIVDECVAQIEQLGYVEGDDNKFAVLTHEENKSIAMLVGITDKVNIISLAFPVFFILVVGLVVLTTMSRLVEEERSIIGCLKTLGFSDGKILLKYLTFSIACCLLGMTLGNVAGSFLLPAVILPAFQTLFFMPSYKLASKVTLGLISSAIMLLAVVAVTIYVALKETKEKPSELLVAKAPNPGRKIFLEKIGFIWKHLSFKYKSTFRNIFRYVGRLLMVVISVAGSTALIMAGFGLRDVASDSELLGDLSAMSDTLVLVAWVVIAFAIALCVLVIYNLTNMNIGERKREIATLKVLGYREGEVSGYIFREIFIMALFGVIIGVPLGLGALAFVFYYLDFGAVSSINIWSYFISAGVTLIAIGIVSLLLYPKIKREDMNNSLKTIE